jgi:hypothetical protein
MSFAYAKNGQRGCHFRRVIGERLGREFVDPGEASVHGVHMGVKTLCGARAVEAFVDVYEQRLVHPSAGWDLTHLACNAGDVAYVSLLLLRWWCATGTFQPFEEGGGACCTYRCGMQPVLPRHAAFLPYGAGDVIGTQGFNPTALASSRAGVTHKGSLGVIDRRTSISGMMSGPVRSGFGLRS